jgi:predicted enzyme related to lactoylglutathione lyase
LVQRWIPRTGPEVKHGGDRPRVDVKDVVQSHPRVGVHGTEGEANVVLGLRTVIYKVKDLDKAKAWYAKAFGVKPYFDQPFYVGFNIGGYELGLDPSVQSTGPGPGGSVAYWGVENIEKASKQFLAAGATAKVPAHDVGGDIKVATFADPFGNLIGLIENPHFKLPDR